MEGIANWPVQIEVNDVHFVPWTLLAMLPVLFSMTNAWPMPPGPMERAEKELESRTAIRGAMRARSGRATCSG